MKHTWNQIAQNAGTIASSQSMQVEDSIYQLTRTILKKTGNMANTLVLHSSSPMCFDDLPYKIIKDNTIPKNQILVCYHDENDDMYPWHNRYSPNYARLNFQ